MQVPCLLVFCGGETQGDADGFPIKIPVGRVPLPRPTLSERVCADSARGVGDAAPHGWTTRRATAAGVPQTFFLLPAHRDTPKEMVQMKQALTAGILWVLLLFGGAWILAPRPGAAEPEKTDTPIRQTEQADSMDSRSVLQVYDGEKTVSMTMAEYLPGVVRGEMPASFEPEALKAQAVAERTFIYYHMLGGRKAAHPDADVCMDYRCCNAWVSQEQAKSNWGDNYEEYDRKIQRSVEETDGQVMLYEGKPILAAFHSSSAGVTAKSSDAWVSDRPYLVSVESPENGDSVPNYYSVNTFTPEEFREKILTAEPTAVLEGSPEGWVTDLQTNSSNRVESVTVGGVSFRGTEVRSILGLRSASFTVECGADGITFHVTGYGHGVGMSQYGANALAREGKTWREILQWYYRGVSIETWEKT